MEQKSARPKKEHAGSSGSLAAVEQTIPHPEPVDGAELLRAIHDKLRRHVVLTEGEASAISLFVVFTFAHDAFQVSAILAVLSPEKRCGKTTLLNLLFKLSKSALGASNITPAVVYRCVGIYHPTLIIDEADTFLDNRAEFIGILNSGQTRTLAFVARSKPDSHDPQFFSTWCPKVIARIGHLPSTLADRSIAILLRRKLPTDVSTGVKLHRFTGENCTLGAPTCRRIC